MIWTKIIEMNDTNAAAWSNRGNCRTSQGRFEEAVADFDRAVALAPEEPDPYLGRGVANEGKFLLLPPLKKGINCLSCG